ncbi:arylsulfatase [Pirellulales bacterium]|nr:arylsulfatase [Pirellulales bacterium]MDB4475408.1 arylsulfatase [Pirellulales bacterium]
MKILYCLLLALVCAVGPIQAVAQTSRPNVIVIMTDDQGYGDIGCHGNPIIKTPCIDRLHEESLRLTNFHVSPYCTPTRAALMTGRYPARTGAYRTSSGRTMLHRDEKTIANIFSNAGYSTGMIGKWHLGDNAPHRPQDRGFQEVLWHRGGGVGQASDYYGNDYFDDTYERNGVFEKFTGYCTDIWFHEAKTFIERHQKEPFFLYLATNAPHGPYRVAPKWSEPYRGSVLWKNGANFYGMIANIDHNLGLLRQHLKDLDLTDNTILIFMTDNGTSNGITKGDLPTGSFRGFNANMRGKKSTIYEGGHRVPCFIHWPTGGFDKGKDFHGLTAHLDILPSLLDLCGIPLPENHHPDGYSFVANLYDSSLPSHRQHYIAQLHGGAGFTHPEEPWDTSCVCKASWRLVNRDELYNLQKDPLQLKNVASDNAKIVAELRLLYEQFWNSISPRMKPVAIDVGSPAENPTKLCSQDWYLPVGNPPWNFSMINRRTPIIGPWHIMIKQDGRYRITLRQQPEQVTKPLFAKRASLTIADTTYEAYVPDGSSYVHFTVDLPAGKTELITRFWNPNEPESGAYFTDVKLLETTHAP